MARGRLLILAAALLWSTSGFFAKANVFESWPVTGFLPARGLMLVFWRAVFATIVLLPLVRRPRWTWKLLPAALLFVVMNISYLSAMVRTTAANAIWMQNTAPVWVFLFGSLLLGDRVQRRDWIMLMFALVGIGIILTFESQGGNITGVVWGLVSGVTYAAVVISLRWLRGEDSAWIIAVNHFVTALCLLPYIVLCGETPSPMQFVFLAGFGMVQMGFPYFLFARGLRTVPGHEGTSIGLIEPVLVPVWAYLAWNEVPAWWTLAGGAFILCGLIVRYAPLPWLLAALRSR